jgi:hypothetical protein
MSDRLERLIVLRDQVTAWLETAAADRAPLVLRLTTILEQIDAIEKAQPATKGTVLDELNSRRAAKSASGEVGPARKQQRR